MHRSHVKSCTEIRVMECRNDRRNAKKTLDTITEGDERITAFLWIIELRSSLLGNINGSRLLPSPATPSSPFLSVLTLLDRNSHPRTLCISGLRFYERAFDAFTAGYCELDNLWQINCAEVFYRLFSIDIWCLCRGYKISGCLMF